MRTPPLPRLFTASVLLADCGSRLTGSKSVSGNVEPQRLLDQGYALIGSAYASNGWAVQEGVEAAEGLYDFFSSEVAEPERVYVWGESLGGLITQLVAENAGWVDGAAPLCGVVGGTNANLDLALDVSYAVQRLFAPDMKLTGYRSWNEAVRNWEIAAEAIETGAGVLTEGPPRIRLIAALVDAPSQTRTGDGSSVSSSLRGYAEAILTAVGYSTFGRWEIEQRVGGNPSQNTGVDYASRISDAERSQIDSLSDGRTDELLAELSGGRVSADPTARAAADGLGNPTGDVVVPTITLHPAADPLVIVQNETLLAERAAGSDLLRQLYTEAPYTYGGEDAPYGAGHCNFTESELVGVIDLVDQWVQTGDQPDDEAIRRAFGPDTGLSLAFDPGPWPADTETP